MRPLREEKPDMLVDFFPVKGSPLEVFSFVVLFEIRRVVVRGAVVLDNTEYCGTGQL